MADRAIRYLLRADQRRGLRRRAQLLAAAGRYHRRRRLLLESGRVLMLLAAVALLHLLTAACTDQVEFYVVLVAFLLWLLGAAFAVMSLVAGQFPVLAAATAAVARTLRGWLLGGL
uniref:Uncharacterized protein n=1 Tax=Oryza meridionalis TaxID=40149 RepID=A0A0E0E3K0_9ORYZ